MNTPFDDMRASIEAEEVAARAALRAAGEDPDRVLRIVPLGEPSPAEHEAFQGLIDALGDLGIPKAMFGRVDPNRGAAEVQIAVFRRRMGAP